MFVIDKCSTVTQRQKDPWSLRDRREDPVQFEWEVEKKRKRMFRTGTSGPCLNQNESMADLAKTLDGSS